MENKNRQLCKTCQYRARDTMDRYNDHCNYILITGESRKCPVEDCNVYVKGRKLMSLCESRRNREGFVPSVPKKRGRPPLPPEERERRIKEREKARREKRKEYQREYQKHLTPEQKAKRVEYQKRYREEHKEEIARREHERYLKKKNERMVEE